MLVNFFNGLKSMKENLENFQFMIFSEKSHQPQTLSGNDFTIDESDKVELIGLTIAEEF